jgi:DNA recombination protein RmuC
LLKTVALTWRQETAARHAQVIADLGRELYGRLLGLADQLQLLGRSIEKCADQYNGMVGSFEGRVLVSARRFEKLGISSGKGRPLPAVAPVEKKVRNVDTKGFK